MWTIDRVKKELDHLRVADGLPKITIPVRANARLTATLGRVRHIKSTCEPISIEFSQKLLNESTDNDIINVIKHEYVHYFLLVATGENHGHDALFRDKCKAIGCTHTKTHNALENEGQFKYEVWCDECGLVATYSRMGKVLKNLDSCLCGKCHKSGLKMIQNW